MYYFKYVKGGGLLKRKRLHNSSATMQIMHLNNQRFDYNSPPQGFNRNRKLNHF